MKKHLFLLIYLLVGNLTFCQTFITIDKDTDEFIENVNYRLYKGDSLVYSNVTLSDIPTKISKDIEYDSISFSRVDYETLGVPKEKIEEMEHVIRLTKKIFTIDEIVISSEKEKEIILGEKNRFIKRRSNVFTKDDFTYGIVFRNEFQKKLLIDKVTFYVEKVKYKTAYRIVFLEAEERVANEGNEFLDLGETIASTNILYLYPKQKNRIEVPLDTDVFLYSDKILFVSFELVDYYDENDNPVTPDIAQKTKLKFQTSENLDYYSKVSNYYTGELSQELLNINRMVRYDFANTLFAKPNKSVLVAPAVLLHLVEPYQPKLNIQKENFKR